MRQSHRQGSPRGRSGGRAGASGYDFQDIYVALQLVKLLMGDRDPVIEVLWEKKAIDVGAGKGAESVHVDDTIIRSKSGRFVYVQVKENPPSGGWSAANFVRSGAALQLWQQWNALDMGRRERTTLRFASAGDVATLAIVVDVARRARTPSELLSDEASEESAGDVRTLAKALAVDPEFPELLAFLKALHFE